MSAIHGAELLKGLSMNLTLSKDKIIRIVGPAKITVKRGCIRVLGYDACEGRDIVISRYRSYAVKCCEGLAEIDVTIGEGGAVEEPSAGEEVIDVWERVANEVAASGGRVLIVGPIESGKTSFSTLLSNIALDKGLRVWLIDADVGQCDLAPPGFIALKRMDTKVVWLRGLGLRGDVLRFVGFITPSNPIAMSRIVSYTLELAELAERKGADIVIINTDGWLSDTLSVEYKLQLVKSLRPRSLVLLGEEASHLLGRCVTFAAGLKVYQVPSPKVVRRREREERRDLRRLNYTQHFKNVKKICIALSEISVIGSCLFSGVPLEEGVLAELKSRLGAEIYVAKRFEDVIVLLVPDDAKLRLPTGAEVGMPLRGLIILRPSDVRGLLVALLDERMEEVGAGIVDMLDYHNGKLCILTDYEGRIGGIVVGRIKINEDWSERVKPIKCLM